MKTLVQRVNTVIIFLVFGSFFAGAQVQSHQSDPGTASLSHSHDVSSTMPPSSPSVSGFPLPPCPPPPPPPPPPSSDECMEQGHQGLDMPDLTPDQSAGIKKIDLKNMADMTPLRNQMQEKRARLSTILITIPIDLKQVDLIADEIGKTAAAMLKAQIRHDQDLRAILTPDQQVLFDARPKPWLRRP
ncbi:MAG: periplasmic heavy metal sensor [Bacteroidetes bacterium]|nr:periplasmic heavy metal sensor [Bacteroidota bacterium]